MPRPDVNRAVGVVAVGALTAHLIATTLFNTPDSFNLDLRRYVGGWTIPGWRFFAPNPGVQNVHLLVRTGDGTSPTAPSLWQDVTPIIDHRALNVALNPRSRGPKALFDAMQQLSVMKSNYARFDWITTSTAYELVTDAARGLLPYRKTDRFQFLLMNYFPAAPEGQRMQPIIISRWESVWPGARS
ncbi:hypothetical protein C5E02_13190 [Rathayibacter rathayi]|uniref:Uncharacterized protein n=1 Tax=Rathayibacter rathayi TaxID=33887 RepID=A0ABX5AA56_RATRA|nr:hypothetical protein [Rathayibacter rathayi]MWV74646.1 hypothetical protein [Rathayibacter rathayi NCPPB 2980 = VKM Ac-1601]AZZ50568.1 hypothetical protein C1O28_13500 [Rathayibacter rathayi]PPF23277.1 hypothetical protein C5C34_09475 [Rathayibacter rathayi]PPF42008.1 hypothetical protein C5C08_15480 [Rathayibacter rathayi]PPF74061.1 hypothetical protein C5C14_15685 [Rathayibacter rathayi]